MSEEPNRSYYALVWNTSLDEDIIVKGEMISEDTVIPEDSVMLYGTNPNDVFKVHVESLQKEIKYDVLTTKQSVRFIKVVEEIELPRDVRIIVWEGSDKIRIAHDDYRIVAPDLFEDLVRLVGCPKGACKLKSKQIDTSLRSKNGRAMLSELEQIMLGGDIHGTEVSY